MDVYASVHAHLKALKERNAKKVHKLRSPAARKKKWAVNGGSVHIKGIDDGADHRLLPKSSWTQVWPRPNFPRNFRQFNLTIHGM